MKTKNKNIFKDGYIFFDKNKDLKLKLLPWVGFTDSDSDIIFHLKIQDALLGDGYTFQLDVDTTREIVKILKSHLSHFKPQNKK